MPLNHKAQNPLVPGQANATESGSSTTSEPPRNPSRLRKMGPAKKTTKTEKERIALLEQDEWAKDIRPKSVICVACDKKIQLDQRSRYYPGLWDKHRSKCQKLKHLEIEKKTKGPPQCVNRQHIPTRDTAFAVTTETFQIFSPQSHSVAHDVVTSRQGEEQRPPGRDSFTDGNFIEPASSMGSGSLLVGPGLHGGTSYEDDGDEELEYLDVETEEAMIDKEQESGFPS